MYSQNNEEQIIKTYFAGRKGNVLDIGANDGKTFSNSYGLILDGWNGFLLEPSVKAFALLSDLHKENKLVKCFPFGIAEMTETKPFWESGSYENKGEDIALVSCINPGEKERWGDKVSFEQVTAHFYTFSDFMRHPDVPDDCKFNFVTIDAEGYDLNILQQIDLNVIGCEMICIEHNGHEQLANAYALHCNHYGLYEIARNGENVLYAR